MFNSIKGFFARLFGQAMPAANMVAKYRYGVSVDEILDALEKEDPQKVMDAVEKVKAREKS